MYSTWTSSMVHHSQDLKSGAGKDSQTDSVFGITETASEASEGLYGAGRFGYSINDTSSAAL